MIKQNNDKNILLTRLLLSLSILVFIRVGTFLPVPGINHGHLAFYLERHSMTKSLVSTFAGNNTFVIGLFTLNIFPYINASILMQVLISVFPNLSKLQKEGGAEGRRTITKLTRLVTLGWALIQSFSIAFYLKRALFDWNLYLAIEIIIWLTTGAMIVLWLSEIITEYGLGNGASLLIYTNIVSNLPNFTKTLFVRADNDISVFSWVLIISIFFIAISGIVLLQEGMRIIPLISSRQLNQPARRSVSPLTEIKNNYIPLRFNQAGVMPIILTTAVLVVPNYISNLGLLPIITLPMFIKSSKFIYWIIYFTLILLFSSFYSTIVLNPKDISKELQKMAVSIPGIRPGVETTFYLKKVMERVTYLGAIMLSILATLPNVIEAILPGSNFNGLGTTSFLILVGVILDLSREIRSIILSNIYNDMFN
jgi:preprotein translocase subunit SecY